VDHEGRADHGGNGNPGITNGSANMDKCTAVRTRDMKQGELKTSSSLKVSSLDSLKIGPALLYIHDHRITAT